MESNGVPGTDFARDVRDGLCRSSRKWLPAKHLYDSVGSALFEAITHIPEYGLTRADERLLGRCAGPVGEWIPGTEVIVAELGSGNGAKTRVIVDGIGAGRVRRYCPIDVSQDALDQCARDLRDIVPVRPYHGTYVDGVHALSADRPTGVPMLLLFLGSSIGNFDSEERATLLVDLRNGLRDGDHVLFGFDLVKPTGTLLRAYDDPTGVTAAFNRNILGRVNRELGAAFDLGSFRHIAHYDESEQRVEMHLESDRRQAVPIPGVGDVCRLARGETIWTESSYKFSVEEVQELMEGAGFVRVEHWIDEQWPFLEGLWRGPS